ncbi:unnamed protein product, partial [Symbiodinium microadriaticum]
FVHPDHQDAIFLYQGLDGEQAKFVCTNLYGEEQVVLAEPGDFKKWRPTKVTIPRLVPDALRDSCGFENSRVVQQMKTKLTAEFLLYEKYMEFTKEDLSNLHFALPTNLYSNAKFGVGKLPDAATNQVLVPFHWVKSTSDPDAVNMACSMKELQKGLKIMCLTNTKNLQPRVQLLQ